MAESDDSSFPTWKPIVLGLMAALFPFAQRWLFPGTRETIVAGIVVLSVAFVAYRWKPRKK
ncbi:MAG: hypothetical protein WAU39_20065 [Polyangiales bacterium]